MGRCDRRRGSSFAGAAAVSQRLDEVRTSSTLIYVNIDLRVLQSPCVSGDAVKLYGLFVDAVNTRSRVGYISRDRMAVYLGKSIRSAERVIGELVSHGIVTARRRFNATSVYTVHHFDTLPVGISQSAEEAVAACSALQPPTLEVVPDVLITDTTDLAEAQESRLTTDLAEASDRHDRFGGSVPVDDRFVVTDTTDLASYQDEVTKTKKKKSSAEAAGCARPEVVELCDRLADRIAENDEDHQRPTITKQWLTECRRLLDLDGRDQAKVAAVIDWCQKDPFWHTVTLSMPKLRKNYNQMRAQALAEWEHIKRPTRNFQAEREANTREQIKRRQANPLSSAL